MRTRTLTPFLALAIVACGGAEMAEDTAMTEETQDYAAGADAASLIEFTNEFATHYNMQHPSMVADFFVDDGLMWSGSTGMMFGKDAINTALAAGMEAASPQVTLEHGDQIIAGNFAVAHGSYALAGEGIDNSGGWMTYSEMIDGEWKLHGLVTSIGEGQDAPNFMMGDLPEGPEIDARVAEGAEYFVTHFNMKHASMVAGRYAEDVISVGNPEDNGRAALEANLQELIDQGAQVEVTPFASAPVGEEYITSIGTFSVTTEAGTGTGHYANVAMINDDGTTSTIWSLVSNHPMGGM